MKTLLLTVLLLAGASHANDANKYSWVNNNNNLAVVLARTHEADRAIMAEKCEDRVVLSLYDFTNYTEAMFGKTVSIRWRVDKMDTHDATLAITKTDSGHFVLPLVLTDAQQRELKRGDTLRIVYKLNAGGYNNLEEYALKGYTRALNNAPDSCEDTAGEYFDMNDGKYF
jgi:hypothetical protein